MMETNVKWPEMVFVTGIDTDAGKSYATGWLARNLMEQGRRVVTEKFVQTGNHEFSEDIELHRKIMDLEYTAADKLHLTAPVIYSYPCSPDLAARIDGEEFDPQISLTAAKTLAHDADVVLMEGAGGLMVPLNGEYLTADFLRDNKLPVIMVTNGTLGSINHTLLTLNAIKDYGLNLFAVVYNMHFDSDLIIADDTRQYIRKWLSNHFPDTYYWEMPSL